MGSNHDDINQVVLWQLDRTSKLAKQYSQREFDKLDLGITVEQWVLLKFVQEHQPLSQKELAKKSTRDPASITRTIDLLEKKGYMRREAIPDNRRQYNIVLTKAGEAFVTKNFELVKAMRELSTKGLTKTEVSSLMDMLLKIQNNMK